VAAAGDAEGATTLAAKVTGVSPDGKTITLEFPPERRGEDARKVEVRITEQTEVTYDGVGANGARPTAGYHARVSLQPGSNDTAARVRFAVVDASRWGRSFLSGKVVGVSPDGKKVTLEMPAGRGLEAQRTDVSLSEQTKVSYAYVAKDAARPTEGYQADVWLNEGSPDAARVHFVDVTREAAQMVGGKVLALATDGSSMTLEVPARVRGEGPSKQDIKLPGTAEATYHGVGPDGARPTEGYHARVWLQEGSTDTASKVMFLKATERGR
jgi:hypothetical protein